MNHPLFSLVAVSALLLAPGAEALTLDPVVVSASKTEQPLSDVTADVELITAEELAERHYGSLIEALNTLAGIDFTQSGGPGAQSSLYVRGFANKYTLVLIDGIRLNDPTSFDGALFDQIALSDIERIEVIKGAQSGIWGADAAAGVINIITKKTKPHSLEAYAETGSFTTHKFGATLAHATDRGDIKVGFDRLITDGFSAAEPARSNPLYGSRFDTLGWERDPYASTTIHAKGGINLSDNDRIEFSHRYVANRLEYDDAGSDNLNNSNRFTQRFSRASYTHTGERNSLELYAGRSDFQRSYYGGYEGKTDEIGVTDTFRYSPEGTLVLGATWQRFDVETAGGSLLATDYLGRALFASHTHTFNGGATVFSETLRYDRYSAFGSKTTGKIGAKQTIGEGSLSANYGTGYLAPSLIQIANPYGAPNPDLKPETIRSFDVTGSYRGLSLTYFHNTIRDMISWYDPDGWMGPIEATYANLGGDSTLQGYEAKVEHALVPSLILNAAYTQLHAVDSEGSALPRRPRDTLKGWFDWYPNDRLHLGLSAQYVGTRYDDAARTIQTGRYALFGGVVNYALTPNCDIYAKFDNIFDRYYQVVDGYATAGRSGYIGIRVTY